MRIKCFPPVVNNQTRILILGTMPGVESLRKQEYYGHPQNQFWKLLGGVLEINLISLSYEQRLELLLKNHIGVWDVIASCKRKGSLDSDMKDKQLNQLTKLVQELPHLKLVCFNGKVAQKHGMDLIDNIPSVVLASSSPAFTLAFEKKLEIWRNALRKYL